jgi:PAS domain S-box-containing protein
MSVVPQQDPVNRQPAAKSDLSVEERERELYAEQVRLLYEQIPVGLAGTAFNAILLTVALWTEVDHAVALTWLAVIMAVTVVRGLFVLSYRRAAPPMAGAARWGRWAVAGLVCSGAGWGLTPFVIFPEASSVHQVFLAFVLGGMVSGGSAVLAPLTAAYLTFIPIIGLPITAKFLTMGGSLPMFMGAMTGLFMVLALLSARNAHATIRTSLALRFENRELIAYLIRASDSLTDEVQVRQRSEDALRERVRLASFAAEVSFALNSNESLDGILWSCAGAAERHLDAALARIWTVGPGDLCGECHKVSWCTNRAECLHLKASAGLSTNLNGEYRRVPLGALKIGRIAQGMGVMVTNDVVGDERLPNKDWLKANGLRSFAGFPLTVQGRVFGVIAVFAREPLSEATLQTLEFACNAIAAMVARKRSEEALRESQAFVDSVIEHLPNMVFVKDAKELKFVRINKAGEELLGHSRESFLGRNDYDFFPREQADFFTAKDREVIDNGCLVDIAEEPVETAKKERRILHTKKIPIVDAAGTPQFVVGISEDITDRKDMERHAKRMEQLALLGQLMGGIAHELKNPLFILSGHLQLLKDMLAQRDYQALPATLEKIDMASERMKRVTERFLHLARPAQARQESCSVGALLQQTLEFLDNELMKSQIRVRAEIPALLPEIVCDPRQMQEVFLNLILNALQAMVGAHGQGTLSVTVSHADDWIEVRVQDDGPGIPAQYHCRLFEPFFSTKPPEKGTGLGLWTVRSNIMALGGTVQYETEEGRGTTFIVRLPTVRADRLTE